jgi:hypothetical protein
MDQLEFQQSLAKTPCTGELVNTHTCDMNWVFSNKCNMKNITYNR